MEIHFSDKNSILGQIISQNSVSYPTKDKKVIQKLDKIFIFEKIKKLSIAHDQGYYWQTPLQNIVYYHSIFFFRSALAKLQVFCSEFEDSNGYKSLNTGAIVGISIISCLLLIIIIVLLLVFCCCPQLFCCYKGWAEAYLH